MDDSATPSGTPDADVLIVGAGPVGLYLALRLGSAGHRIIVVEKQPTHYPLPRAVTFDDEIARLFAEIGIDSDNDPIIEQTDDRVLLRNGDRDTIGVLDWRGVTSAGWHRLNWFHQPTLEKRLAAMVGELGTVTVLRSWELADVYQDNAGVTISGRVAKSAGKHNAATLRGRYLVGADGANSRVREQAELEVTDLGFYFDWLICDVIPQTPRRSTRRFINHRCGSSAIRTGRRRSCPEDRHGAAGSSWLSRGRTSTPLTPMRKRGSSSPPGE